MRLEHFFFKPLFLFWVNRSLFQREHWLWHLAKDDCPFAFALKKMKQKQSTWHTQDSKSFPISWEMNISGVGGWRSRKNILVFPLGVNLKKKKVFPPCWSLPCVFLNSLIFKMIFLSSLGEFPIMHLSIPTLELSSVWQNSRWCC